MGRLYNLTTILNKSHNNINAAHYLTDLQIVEDKNAKYIVLRRYCNIPFLGRCISYLRYKIFDDSAIKSDIKTFCTAYQNLADEKLTKLFNNQSQRTDLKLNRLINFVEALKNCMQTADPFITYSLKSKYDTWFQEKFPATTIDQVKNALNNGFFSEVKKTVEELSTHFIALTRMGKVSLASSELSEVNAMANLYKDIVEILERDSTLFKNSENKVAAFKEKLTEALSELATANDLEVIVTKHQDLMNLAKKLPDATILNLFQPSLMKFIDQFKKLRSMLALQNSIKDFNATSWENQSHDTIMNFKAVHRIEFNECINTAK